ncbi:MAG: hypothetical protein PHW62_00050 [Candidatus Ratteibacteria bacterium]|nr:hypothetical protein [Candidatus Ratteibacteria bacterium]
MKSKGRKDIKRKLNLFQKEALIAIENARAIVTIRKKKARNGHEAIK